MNISHETIEMLKAEFNHIGFWDMNLNETSPEKANQINIAFDKSGNYIGKWITALKREMTFSYIMDKVNADKVYKNFSSQFNKVINKLGVSAYPTTYGIGIFIALSLRKETEKLQSEIETLLDKTGIKYTTEYSDAHWVFRYKISKSAENIAILNDFIKH